MRSCLGNRFARGDKGVGHGYHLVALLDAACNICKLQRISAAVDSDAVLRSAETGKFLLKVLYHGAADIPRFIYGRTQDSHQFVFKLHMRCNQVEKRYILLSHAMLLSLLAGFPATMVFAGTSFVTTLPAPTMAFSPMVTPHRIVAFDPMDAPFLTYVGTTLQSCSVCRLPPLVAERGYLSLVNMTPWPTNAKSSITTPSQIKLWLCILQWLPTIAFFWISTQAPILVLSPTVQPYRLTNFDSLTFAPSFTSGATETNSINSPLSC